MNKTFQKITRCNRFAFAIIFCFIFYFVFHSSSGSGLQSESEILNSESRNLQGQSSTLLPDGRVLILGGQNTGGPTADGIISDQGTRSEIPLADKLRQARAWHTATMLPDGNVLIFGGVTSDGQVLDNAELFLPQTKTFQPLSSGSLTPRAYHTATLLTGGEVLIVGGISNNNAETLNTAELWDPKTKIARVVPGNLLSARHSHTATLLRDGTVLFSAGISRYGKPLEESEIYDPLSQKFTSLPVPIHSSITTQLEDSLPADRAKNVPLDSIIALRFSKPLRVETVKDTTVRLTSPFGAVVTSVIPAENGMLVFVTPEQPLLPGMTYTISIDGLSDRSHIRLPVTTLAFTTSKEQIPEVPESDNEEWIPDMNNLFGTWRTGRADSPWRSLPPLKARGGVTALAGQVLKLNGEPLSNVTLRMTEDSTRTDHTGRFLLTNIAAGRRELIIDGRTANKPGRTYGIFVPGVDVLEHQTNVLPFTIWMTPLDMQNAVTIPSPTTSEVVVTTPRLPGLEVHIPPDTIIRDIDGNPVTVFSVTPIPLDRPPMPGPQGVQFPFLFTMQPGGSTLEGSDGTPSAGISIVFPNYENQPPGARMDYWRPDPMIGWHVYGQGTVSANGTQIFPDPGVVVHKLSCGSALGHPLTAPAEGPPQGGCLEKEIQEDGDPVDCYTGLFIERKTDLFLPDVLPIAITRTYRPRDTIYRPFGLGATHPYEIFLIGDSTCTYADLILPDGGRIHYNRTSGTGCTNAVMEHTSTPTAFYKSLLSWNALRAGWDIKLKDGTVYEFLTSPGYDTPKLSAIVDRNGNKLSVTRDGYGLVNKVTSPNGRWITFNYDGSSRITQVTDNIGRSVSYTYNLGRLWKVTDPVGSVTEYTYTYDSSSYGMLTVKYPRGFLHVTNEYDANGRVIRQTRADGTTYQFAYTLDGSGKVIQTDVTNPRGYVRRMTFNSDGYVLTNTHALGTPIEQTITYERETDTNLLLSVTDALGRKTSYTYDAMGNLTNVTLLSGTPEAVTTTVTYESTFNQPSSIADPLNHITAFTYDANGNPITITDPLMKSTNITYNLSGQPTSVADPLMNTTQLSYSLGDLTGVTNPLGNSITQFFDAAGRPLSRNAPLGQSASYFYDELNRPTRAVDALQGETTFAYDANSNLLSVTDAQGGVTSYTYDDMDRRVSRTDPLMQSESYIYDANGNPTQMTDRKNQVTIYLYDELDRLTQVTYAGGATTTFSYDAGNRLTQAVDSLSGTITLTYDDLDRLISETTPQGLVSYTYDAVGRRISMTVAGQAAVNYTYDDANRLTQVTQGSSTVLIAYDDSGRRTSMTLPNGIVAEYSYNTASQLTGITYKLGVTVLGDLIYEYDAAGRREKVSGSYAGTALPQALGSTTYNAANQQLTFGAQTLTYDNNGNLTSDGTNSYTWNSRNQLVSISGPGLTASFEYDAFGRRMTKTINGTSTSFLYDGLTPVQELSGTTPTANMLTGLGIDEYFTRSDSAGIRNLLTDALGSTIALTDTSGTQQIQYTYEPFGKTTTTGAANSNSLQYTGRENDGTGLIYYRARYYHPGLQRFISEDPIGFAGGDSNLYAYVGNNPTNFIDPFGYQSQSPDSVSKSLEAAIRSGNVDEIQMILKEAGETLAPEVRELAQHAVKRFLTKAKDIIANECKGSINKKFPSEMLDKTLQEIFELAKRGNKAAQTAKKLLQSGKYKK